MQLKQSTSCHSASGLQKLQARQRSLQAGQPFLHSSGHWPLVDKGMPFESKTQHPRRDVDRRDLIWTRRRYMKIRECWIHGCNKNVQTDRSNSRHFKLQNFLCPYLFMSQKSERKKMIKHRFGRDSLGFCSKRLCFVCFRFFQNFSWSSSSFKGYERRNCGKVCTWKLWYFHRSGRVFWRKYSESLYKMMFLHVELCQNMNKSWSNRLVP